MPTPEELEAIKQAEAEAEASKQSIIGDFMKSQKYIDHINAEKGQAVKTFQDEKLTALIDAETQKRIEAKNHKEPWQIQIDEQKKELAIMKEEKAIETRGRLVGDNKNEALKILADKKLPSSILDFLVSDDKEKTTANVGVFTKMMEDFTLALKKGTIDKNNTLVPGKDDTTISGHGIAEPTSDDPKEWEAYFKAVRTFNKKK